MSSNIRLGQRGQRTSVGSQRGEPRYDFSPQSRGQRQIWSAGTGKESILLEMSCEAGAALKPHADHSDKDAVIVTMSECRDLIGARAVC